MYRSFFTFLTEERIFKFFSLPSFSSAAASFGPVSSSSLVIEVIDFLWKQLETPLPRTLQDCIIKNAFKMGGRVLTDQDLTPMSVD